MYVCALHACVLACICICACVCVRVYVFVCVKYVCVRICVYSVFNNYVLACMY